MNYFDFITKYQTPAIPIQNRDATSVEVKEPIRSVKRTFSSPYIEQQYNAYLEKRPWDLVGVENLIANLEKQQNQIISQGKEKSEEEKREAESRVERQGEIEKEQRDREKAAEVVGEGLNYLSPTYWVNQVVDPEYQITSDAGQLVGDILLDPTTYLTAGIVPAAKSAAKKGVSKAVRKTVQEASKKTDVTENFIKFTGIPRITDPKIGLTMNKVQNELGGTAYYLAKQLQSEGVDLSQLSSEHLLTALNKRNALLNDLSKQQRLVVTTPGKGIMGIQNKANLLEGGDNKGVIVFSEDWENTSPQKIGYVHSSLPKQGIGLDLYDAAIRTANAQGYPGIQSGNLLLSADKTVHTLEHYPNKKIINNNGRWEFENEIKTNMPVYQLTEPVRNTPVKSAIFNPKIIDENGVMHIDLADPNIYKSMFLPWMGYNLMKNSNQNTDENLTH